MLSFLPNHIFEKITDISPEFLQEKSIRLLLMDFDNTMLPYTTNTPSPELLRWVKGMKDAGILLCIVSNSKKARVPNFSEKHGIACITHAAKPRTKGIFSAMERFGFARDQVAMVGDQIFTDTLGARRADITALLVRSINNHTIWLKLRHVFELPFIALARKRRVQL